ncbi:hypothetical protein A2154_02985 [Candidatus Gottesmanbacteria bacterium RBG_16_43_7]|uniref:Abasic site processing protein n=1 Tax=Candidatus Gottesmanbacteria bacterium RBG_16_43_7 TaxID=1798373 RepID=A0A1F5Z977_9BACT|nr:MAG: hypothetical protein A2154_02985 [Candidatus Gottesmanbacteria bacterium RBG_16_43_7]
MCGRYALAGSPDKIEKRFGVREASFKFSSKYNVTPGAMMPIVKHDVDDTVAVLAKWGLVPFWAKDPAIGYKMINARAETVIEKPAFRKAFTQGRCLVPTSGFYEWTPLRPSISSGLRGAGSLKREKIPYFIHLKSADIFSFAGLFDIWHDAEGRDLLTFTILTTEPNSVIADIHSRMPVILSKAQENVWISPSSKTDTLTAFLTPLPSTDIEAYKVSTAVNNPENDSPELLKKAIYPVNPTLL